jgi:hypothetical protein
MVGMRRILFAFGLVALAPLHAPAADDIDQIHLLTQPQFRQLSEDMGSALSYKAVIPATPLGTTGFDIGFEVTATKLENPDAWDQASSGSTSSTVYLPKLHIHKGLPFGFDIGAFYSAVPDSNVTLTGAELRYALVQGGVAAPALGLRATYSKLSGVEQLELNTTGLELTVSKGFAIATPYAGVGRVRVDATPRAGALTAEDFGLTKYFVGANFNLAVLNIAVEADRTGEATTYGAKFGWRF